MGAGESGVGAALLARSKGYNVFVSDYGQIEDSFIKELQDAGIEYEQNGHTESRVIDCDLLIKSPGIPENAHIVQLARKSIEIISEIEFASKFTGAKIIGITGTNGKTTTTELTYHLLKTSGIRVGVGGNIGTSMSRMILINTYDWLVIELSSFQLDDIVEFHPQIAIILNITPDHLNRYVDFNHYADSKFKLLKNMEGEDKVIFWNEDKVIQEKLLQKNGTFQSIPVSLVNANVPFHRENKNLVLEGQLAQVDEMPLKGDHNHINMMCASAAAKAAGVSDDSILDGLMSFQGIPHRMEMVEEINGVTFINDSKATNVEAVFYALGAYPGPITWIAGGQDKGNDYSKILPLVIEKVNALVCLGVDNTKLKQAFTDVSTISETQNMKEAARMALDYSERNDVVLLSPACASFDLFKSYEDRGDQFREAVTELKLENEKTSQI